MDKKIQNQMNKCIQGYRDAHQHYDPMFLVKFDTVHVPQTLNPKPRAQPDIGNDLGPYSILRNSYLAILRA